MREPKREPAASLRPRRGCPPSAALLAAFCLIGGALSCGGGGGGAAAETEAQTAAGTGNAEFGEEPRSPGEDAPASGEPSSPEEPPGTSQETAGGGQEAQTAAPLPPVQSMLLASGVLADPDVPPELETIPASAPSPTEEAPPAAMDVSEALEDSTPAEDVPSALANRFWPGFPTLLDPALIRSGGPPPDGIRPIDSPAFEAASSVGYLEDEEAVLALEINGDARAYPLRIMTRHELVNDRVGGIPVTVSYCPLCNSGVAYDRRVGYRVLDFGTSGSLYQSSLVMYDRQTQSLWTHFDGTAVVGELAGIRLHFYPVAVVAWKDWLEAYPGGRVLTPESGYGGGYGRNPYVGYENSPALLSESFQSEPFDERLPPKERVIGIRSSSSNDAVAVRHACLRLSGVIAAELDGAPLVVWNRPGARSAIDASEVASGRDVGSTGVFAAEMEPHGALTFTPTEDGFRDAETGSDWNLFGLSVAGTLQGSRLMPLEFLDTFWFAWATFEDDTRIVPSPETEC